MPDRPLATSAVATIAANGTATIQIGPQIARESWDLDSVTMTSLGMTVSISQYGQVVDSTANDPRPTVTTDTAYHLPTGGVIVCAWSGGTVGTQVTVTVHGTRRTGGNGAIS